MYQTLSTVIERRICGSWNVTVRVVACVLAGDDDLLHALRGEVVEVGLGGLLDEVVAPHQVLGPGVLTTCGAVRGADRLVDALVVGVAVVGVGVQPERRAIEKLAGVLVLLDHPDVPGDLRVLDHRDGQVVAPGVVRVDRDRRARGGVHRVAGGRGGLHPPVGAEGQVADRAGGAAGRGTAAVDDGVDAGDHRVEGEGGTVHDVTGLRVVLDDLEGGGLLRVGRVHRQGRVLTRRLGGRVDHDRVRRHQVVAGGRGLLEDVVGVAPRDVVVGPVEGQRAVHQGRVGEEVRVRVGATLQAGRAVRLTPELEVAAGELVPGRGVELVELDRPLLARVVDRHGDRRTAVGRGEGDVLRVRVQPDAVAVEGDLLEPVGLLPVQALERRVTLGPGDLGVDGGGTGPAGDVGIEVERHLVERGGAVDAGRGLGLVDAEDDLLQRVAEGGGTTGRALGLVSCRTDREALGVTIPGPPCRGPVRPPR